jgi:hypothetical protein
MIAVGSDDPNPSGGAKVLIFEYSENQRYVPWHHFRCQLSEIVVKTFRFDFVLKSVNFPVLDNSWSPFAVCWVCWSCFGFRKFGVCVCVCVCYFLFVLFWFVCFYSHAPVCVSLQGMDWFLRIVCVLLCNFFFKWQTTSSWLYCLKCTQLL